MKILLLAILAMLLSIPAFAHTRNVQDNHKIVYHINDASGNPVTGQTVALSIQRVSDSYFFDFNDSTFKASGWTSKTTNLTEDSTNGFYYYLFNPPSSETVSNEYVFVVDNASVTYGDHRSEIVSYLDYSKFRGR